MMEQDGQVVRQSDTVNRNEGLDWLRGLMAISIMLYHLDRFIFGDPGSESLIGRLGIYGVSIFFILSGLSMAMVYARFLNSGRNTLRFFIRRFFRIVPLMVVAFGLLVMLNILRSIVGGSIHHSISWGIRIMRGSVPTGSWSIFNEVIFYIFTPLLIMVYNKKIWTGNVVALLITVAGMSYSIIMQNPSVRLMDQWGIYINPANHFFFYTAGIALFYNFQKIAVKSWLCLVFTGVFMTLFAILPYSGNQIAIVAGFNRVLFLFLCVAIVFSFYKLKTSLPEVIRKPLYLFGVATYSVYIFHTIVLRYIQFFFRGVIELPKPVLFGVTIAVTVPLAIVSYYYLERPFIRLGKRLSR